MGQKRTPEHLLPDLLAEFSCVGEMNISSRAADDIRNLGMKRIDALNILRALTNNEFDQSLTYEEDPTCWHDVYHPYWNGLKLYVKFSRKDGSFILNSFHPAY